MFKTDDTEPVPTPSESLTSLGTSSSLTRRPSKFPLDPRTLCEVSSTLSAERPSTTKVSRGESIAMSSYHAWTPLMSSNQIRESDEIPEEVKDLVEEKRSEVVARRKA
jgi:hypothetical protein